MPISKSIYIYLRKIFTLLQFTDLSSTWARVKRNDYLLTGRNLHQNQAQDEQPLVLAGALRGHYKG